MCFARVGFAVMVLLASACTRSSSSDPALAEPSRGQDDAAVAASQPRESFAMSDAAPALTSRLDLELEIGESTPIPELGATATLLSADRVRVEHKGGIGHRDRAVIRFERPGEDPPGRNTIEEQFGPEVRVKTVYGHSMAVFGGKVLSIFPPGDPVIP
jgi:hypothetical protein